MCAMRRMRASLLAYLQLFRAPNVFTALADVTMGFLFVRGSLRPLAAFLPLATASALLYTAGMVLNDVYDFEADARQRPERPLPSGRIPLGRAKRLGYEMLLVGIAMGWLGGYAGSAAATGVGWRSGTVATLLAACVLLYDAAIKNTPAGPLLMGMCRLLNVLLGMSLASLDRGQAWLLHYGADQLLVAGGIGLYIAGVAWYARSEATTSHRGPLVGGTALMIAGVSVLALFPRVSGRGSPHYVDERVVWPLLMAVLGACLVWRCARGIVDPRAHRVQAAVKQCILSLIILDASLCLLTCPWYFAVGVLALLAPAVILGRWVYST
jgi:4-hydroxybenzoate polyprenyltransferase